MQLEVHLMAFPRLTPHSGHVKSLGSQPRLTIITNMSYQPLSLPPEYPPEYPPDCYCYNPRREGLLYIPQSLHQVVTPGLYPRSLPQVVTPGLKMGKNPCGLIDE